MTKPTQKSIAKTVLNTHGETYSQQIGIRLKNAPAPLFQLLNASLLMSARIASDQAVEAATALRQANLDTPRKMVDTRWQDRVETITDNGYKRFDERGSTQLGKTAQFLIKRYDGDLRKLRDEAGNDVAKQQHLLQQFQGIGPTGADIFLREVQGVWSEVYPYADAKVTQAARKLQLPAEAKSLARLVARVDFPRFVAGLVRIELANQYDQILQHAA